MRYYLDDLKIIVKRWNNGEKGEKCFWLYHQTEWEGFWNSNKASTSQISRWKSL